MPNSSPEPLLHAGDIQASILPGFSRIQQLLAGFSVSALAGLKALFKLCASSVTPMADALPHKQLRKAILLGQTLNQFPDPLWLSLSLGRSALVLLGQQSIIDLDEAFSNGMWRHQGRASLVDWEIRSTR